jgi:hypothetical protein
MVPDDTEENMRKLLATCATAALLATTSMPAQAYERWLDIHNNSSYEVCEVYISHVGTGAWQSNRLSYCLSPGEVVRVDPGYQQGYCKMDLQFITTSGDVAERYDFNICDETDYFLYD